MATITDQTYFIRERIVPPTQGEVGLPTEAVTVANAKLQSFIDYYEPEIIKMIIGETLYDDYIAGRTTTGNKWKTFDAYLFDATTKKSLVADYIFCKYWKDKDTSVGDGTVRVNAENPNRVSYQNRTIPVYNRMVDEIVKAVTFLAENYTTYYPNAEYDGKYWMDFMWTDGYTFFPIYDNGIL